MFLFKPRGKLVFNDEDEVKSEHLVKINKEGYLAGISSRSHS